MASYILIDYDTTRPEIVMYAPVYTTNDTINVITIESNEPLSSYQEFYAIDNLGNRYNYTFHKKNKNTYIGKIQFNYLPVGIIKIFARVKDEVDNISNLIYKAIEIKENIENLSIISSVLVRKLIIEDSNTKIQLSTHSSGIDLTNRSSNLPIGNVKTFAISDSNRNFKLEIKDTEKEEV